MLIIHNNITLQHNNMLCLRDYQEFSHIRKFGRCDMKEISLLNQTEVANKASE